MAEANLPQTINVPNGVHTGGARVIPAFKCIYPPAIDADDILLVDFDINTVEYGSLYLVEEIKDGRVVWMGCRRFDRQPGKIMVDANGAGDWQDFGGYAADHWRIAGVVKEVFKPSLKG